MKNREWGSRDGRDSTGLNHSTFMLSASKKHADALGTLAMRFGPTDMKTNNGYIKKTF